MTPRTMEEAIEALDEMLDVNDKEEIREMGDPDTFAIRAHHGLGRRLRNIWGLWKGSALARHMREVHMASHPDDMSGVILRTYFKSLTGSG